MNRRTLAAIVLALLLPGAGHIYLGRRGRGIAYFCIVVFLFIVGLSVDGRLYTVQPGNVLSFLATIGSMGAGLLYLFGRMIGPPGDITSLPSGHDAWVVGDEPAVVVDWYGASEYAKGG